MSADDTTSTTSGSLRDAHKELTRERILDAAIDLLEDEELDQVTVADVARIAGVTERTVYRHFSTREELLKATWPQMQKRVGTPGFARNLADLIEMPGRIFPNFDRIPGAVRASAYSKAGRELRLAVNEERKAAFLNAVKEALPNAGKAEIYERAAIVQLICSAWGWSVMRDFWGLDAERSARAARTALLHLLELDPDTGEPASPNAKPSRKKKG